MVMNSKTLKSKLERRTDYTAARHRLCYFGFKFYSVLFSVYIIYYPLFETPSADDDFLVFYL